MNKHEESHDGNFPQVAYFCGKSVPFSHNKIKSKLKFSGYIKNKDSQNLLQSKTSIKKESNPNVFWNHLENISVTFNYGLSNEKKQFHLSEDLLVESVNIKRKKMLKFLRHIYEYVALH